MHTTITPFTLTHWKERRRGEPTQWGWQGTSPEFGDIRVVHPAAPHRRERVVTEVRGGLIPTGTFEARGIHTEGMSRPSLNRATLRLGDGLVQLSRNRWALTHGGRSLRMRYLGDDYRLTAIDRKSYTLSRIADGEDPGVVLTVRQSGRGKSKRMTVQAAGRVLHADIALAALFAGVDRSVLTRRGAVRAGFSRIFDLWAESQY
ncbi:hypothetical protein ACFPM3_21380 [Streptomyces coeruleoprunus]|uniref:Uncharacterized protein n=1 Tax=Streptomyces coeruleoprunus TaxID=285563 RepID=A0ABV9XMD3_9ACTN